MFKDIFTLECYIKFIHIDCMPKKGLKSAFYFQYPPMRRIGQSNLLKLITNSFQSSGVAADNFSSSSLCLSVMVGIEVSNKNPLDLKTFDSLSALLRD